MQRIWKGEDCSIKNECSPSCKHGGYCNKNQVCECPNGYSGSSCETSVTDNNNVKFREICYSNTFETVEEQNDCGDCSSKDFATFETSSERNGKVLKISTSSTGYDSVNIDFDITMFRGLRILIKYHSKASGTVSQNDRIFLRYKNSADEAKYVSPNLEGDHDWKEKSFVADIPADAHEGKIFLGFAQNNAYGTVWFDDISITLVSYYPIQENPTPKYKGHNLPRLRGFMSPAIQRIIENDIRSIAEDWNGNLIRLQTSRSWEKDQSGEYPSRDDYQTWMAAELDKN